MWKIASTYGATGSSFFCTAFWTAFFCTAFTIVHSYLVKHEHPNPLALLHDGHLFWADGQPVGPGHRGQQVRTLRPGEASVIGAAPLADDGARIDPPPIAIHYIIFQDGF